MKRRTITIIAVLFAFVLSGLIFIQVYWITNAININDQQFRYQVNRALDAVVREMEGKELMDRLMKEIGDISPDSVTAILPVESPIYGKIVGYDPQTGIHITTDPAELFRSDSLIGQPHRITLSPEMLTEYIAEVIPDSYDETMEAGVVMRVSNQIVYLENIMEKILTETPDLRERINPEQVNSLLKRSLNNVGINLEYEFAVRSGNSRIIYTSPGFTYSSGPNIFLRQLFPNDPVPGQNMIQVYFSKEKQYKFVQIGLLGFSSIIFTILLVVVSSATFSVIVRQKKMSEIRSDFINNMTHEFKTPIATISLAADTITNPRVINDEVGIKHFVSMIKKENSRMNRQVETILQIASLDRHDIQFRFGDVPIHSIIERAVEVMEFQIQQRGGVIALNLQAVDSVIYGDAEHLSNLMHNLLDNANKYSPEKPEITISTSNRDEGVVISVSDKGAGMSKSVQARIFERFYRQPAGNIHNVKGFGLGLSYVKSIVDAHKGVIELTSEPGKGTRFDIYLPFNWEE